MPVDWPDRREDIVNALTVLAAADPGAPGRKPDLTDAVHWLIDDTWWDTRDPAGDIGKLLTGPAEARAVTSVIQPLLAILTELGPAAPDADYLSHPRWLQVQTAATVCLHLLKPPALWFPPEPLLAASLAREAEAEIGAHHELAGHQITAIMKCAGCDSVIYSLDDGTFALVHLTWAQRPEPSPWPATRRLPSYLALESAINDHQH